MKKIVKWLAVISIVVFVIAWGIIGLKISDNNYLITVEAYIGLISLIVFFVCVIYVKVKNRVPIVEKQINPLENTALTVVKKSTNRISI